MIKLLNRKQYYILAGLIIAAVVLVTLGNLQVVRSFTAGNDLLAHWQGTRTFIYGGSSPYSEQAAADITTAIHDAHPESTAGSYRFLAPLYSLLFYAPFAVISNSHTAIALWMTFLEGVLLAAGMAVIRLGSWKKPFLISILLIVYLMLSFPSMMAILNGNLVIISLALIIFAVKAMSDGNDEASGLMLGLSLVKPDAVYAVLILLLVWAIIQRRYRIIYWFAGVLILLFGFSILLIPDWFVQYLKTVLEYSFNNPILAGLSGAANTSASLSLRFSIVKGVVIAAILIIEWFIVKVHSTKRLFWLVGITLAFGLWVGSHVANEFLIFTLPGFFFSFELIAERWKSRSNGIIAGLIILLFVSQWLFSGFLVSQNPVSSSNIVLQILLPGITLILLYWSRWWVLHGKKLDEPNQFINL